MYSQTHPHNGIPQRLKDKQHSCLAYTYKVTIALTWGQSQHWASSAVLTYWRLKNQCQSGNSEGGNLFWGPLWAQSKISDMVPRGPIGGIIGDLLFSIRAIILFIIGKIKLGST